MKSTAMRATWDISQGTLSLLIGDITRTDAEAVVNAANPQLRGGGGVDGALHRAAGPELLAAGRKWVEKHGPLPAGKAVITPGFNLQARWVIHTVGPVWRGGNQNESRLLRNAYASSLELAKENGIRSIAFPAISCGVYGYPIDQAATIALESLKQGLDNNLVAEARIYIFSSENFEQWMAAARSLMGTPRREN